MVLGVLDWTKEVWEIILRLVLSIVCGFAIGFERKTRSKEAGIRTHAIVCMAAALFMIVSKYMVSAPFNRDISASGDPTRIASQVVTGIGFLGAGIIMYRKDVMHGLTTAAGVWATAAIGMAIGSGFIVSGVCATLFILILQIIFHLPIKVFHTRHLSIIKLQLWVESDDVLNEIIFKIGNPDDNEKHRIKDYKKITSYTVKTIDEKLIATVEVTTSFSLTVDSMNKIVREYPSHILYIEHVNE